MNAERLEIRSDSVDQQILFCILSQLKSLRVWLKFFLQSIEQ